MVVRESLSDDGEAEKGWGVEEGEEIAGKGGVNNSTAGTCRI
jgi:hypothetical protein